MLSLDDALACYAGCLQPQASVSLGLDHAHGLVLAEDVQALLPLPPMTQSAMDGYAVRSADLAAAADDAPVSLPLAFHVAAGQQPTEPLPAGQCARILTGAPLPDGADAIEIQECVQADERQVSFSRPMTAGANVRQVGEELRPGQQVLSAGMRLNARRLAIAASSGHAELPVHRRLRASLIISGDELVAPGTQRDDSQIFESNGVFLRNFLAEQQVLCISTGRSPDRPGAMQSAIAQALARSDLVIVSGGASVGDRDFSREAAAACGVTEKFWKVAQKPGKPISFGLGPQEQAVLILPGNPASVHACAQVHLRTVISLLQGETPPATVRGRLQAKQRADSQRELLLRARYAQDEDGLRFEVLPRQASHMLSNLAQAQALLRVPPGRDLAAGDVVEAWLLD